MPNKDPRVDAYIAKSASFAQPILKHLREIVHAGCPEVQETLKWSMPHFDYKGVMCGVAAFKAHCTFGFWKGPLIFSGEQTAEEAAMGQFGRITSVGDLPADKILIGYVRKAAALNDAGVKSPARLKPREKRPAPEVPDYFAAALKQNAVARKHFDNFSPSKQREYVAWLTDAKRDETRKQRLATSIEWISEGKPRNWKHMPHRS